jgi:hypothetical protein
MRRTVSQRFGEPEDTVDRIVDKEGQCGNRWEKTLEWDWRAVIGAMGETM